MLPLSSAAKLEDEKDLVDEWLARARRPNWASAEGWCTVPDFDGVDFSLAFELDRDEWSLSSAHGTSLWKLGVLRSNVCTPEWAAAFGEGLTADSRLDVVEGETTATSRVASSSQASRSRPNPRPGLSPSKFLFERLRKSLRMLAPSSANFLVMTSSTTS
mmetsp:Transcript_75165/g.207328  ORF Transcript_75165/g.207328 Transcript_75165/m.207328 type:complete len:160 (-) Transcript_75165:209-688(-)